jgi:hypothetical protein
MVRITTKRNFNHQKKIDYQQLSPPSMTSVCPVIHVHASEHIHTTASAISSIKTERK